MNFHHIFCAILALYVVSLEARTYSFTTYYNGGDQANCEIKSNGLKTIKQVQDAIDKAKEGDIIRLDPIVYEGDLHINVQNNQKYISLIGDNQCHKNTVIRGQVSVSANYWMINAIVFEKTEKAIDVKRSENIRLKNLVMNQINGNAITVYESNNVHVDNLVVDNIGKNALDFNYTSEIRVRNSVISNVGEVALKFDNCYQIDLENNVARNVVSEVIKVTGATTNVKIAQTVINGDSQKGQGWMWLEGDFYRITNTVATGSPRNGIVVNGCYYSFNGNICTMGGYGYCIYMNNKRTNCRNDIAITNLNIGGRGLYNRY